MNKPIFIAEVGVNHNGRISLAKKLISIASKSGADYVKFQSYKTENLVSSTASLAKYQRSKSVKNQYELLKKYELTFLQHQTLIRECKKKKIKFISSPFDLESIDMLKKLKLETIKIPSGEIDNVPYLVHLGKLNKKLIMSTGMSTFNEIKKALKILIKSGTPLKKITVLHCNSQYPTPENEANILTIKYLKKKLGCSIGYSDHTKGYLASTCAVVLGADVIEKHITLNSNSHGPDHKASMHVKNLKEFISSLKNIKNTMGIEEKLLSKKEKINKIYVRKSIFAKKNITKGEKFSKENLITLRPAKFISASKWKKLLKLKSKYNFSEGKPIKI